MAWCPFAVHKPLSENHTQGSIVPRAIINHTAVSGADSLFDFFQNSSVLESHFYVRMSGVIEQYMDTQIMADANKNANTFAVSIETEDNREVIPYSAKQLDALVRLHVWLCMTHRIPKQLISNAYGSGIGWHVQFGAPGPWTPVSKSCPGQPRIHQILSAIIPRVQKTSTSEGFLMALSDKEQDELFTLVKEISTKTKNVEAFVEPPDSWKVRVQWQATALSSMQTKLDKLQATVDALTANEG